MRSRCQVAGLKSHLLIIRDLRELLIGSPWTPIFGLGQQVGLQFLWDIGQQYYMGQFGTATFSRIALRGSYFKMYSEIPDLYKAQFDAVFIMGITATEYTLLVSRNPLMSSENQI